MREITTLSERETAYIGDSLCRLREHFRAYGDYSGREFELIEFANYEGAHKDAASGRIVEETAPFALGQLLVSHYGFEWMVMNRVFEVATYAVKHSNMDEPIDLLKLEQGEWYEEDPKDDEGPRPGERTIDSLDPILRAANVQRRPGR